MQASFSELLQEHRARGTALGAFTCYNFETAAAVLQAAQERTDSVIILISEKSFATAHGDYLVAALRAVAERAPVPVCLQLDHISDLRRIEAAFALGVGAVMADGSRLSFEQNIAFVREAVAIAQRYGGYVEAELGRVEGDEDIATAARAGAFTDPEQAAIFVERAQPACLAVSIGNVHGVYQHPPALDWERLKKIHEQTTAPLSLHGASGLSDEDLRRAITYGIAKINVNTELRSRYVQVAAEQAPQMARGSRLLELQLTLTEALAQVAGAKLDVYNGR
ncbi:MAG TPA: class II fructose-bisphosphate aldolase [Ktedonobacteraceae bacterium]|nr:class II fructose-bisphosphate aldolase [Ktedonobacteraceae bacterium]